MNLFKDMLKDSESLFIDEIALDPEFIPKILKFRENEQQYIATCIKPLFQKRNGKNLFIFGNPGIGKTAAIKWVLRDLEQETNDIIPIYINCWKKDTSFKIVSEICQILDYKFTHNKRTDELLKVISNILNKKNAVFCFDEVDKLKEFDILYSLLEDIYRKTILLITNEKSWLATLDARIKSRLNPELLEFKQYNLNETEGILKERIGYAFIPNIFEKNAFDALVKKCFELKDIRTGLFLLKESGTLAENESSRKVLLKHSNLAISKLNDFKVKGSSDLEQEEKIILDLIKENSGEKLKDIYEIYKKNGGKKAYSTFHRKIEDLKKSKLIEVEASKEGGKFSILKYKKLTDF